MNDMESAIMMPASIIRQWSSASFRLTYNVTPACFSSPPPFAVTSLPSMMMGNSLASVIEKNCFILQNYLEIKHFFFYWTFIRQNTVTPFLQTTNFSAFTKKGR